VSITDILSVSPNPFDNYIQVNYVGANASFKVELSGCPRAIIGFMKQKFLIRNQVMKLPTDQLSSGIYFIQCGIDQGQKHSVVKNR
jgi:hypothetical protein